MLPLRIRPAGHPCGAPAWRSARVACLLLLLAALAACGGRTVPLEDAPLPYRQAEDSFRLGNYEKAARAYQIFLDSESSEDYPELVPRAFYRLALSEYRRGRYAECLAALDKMERRLPDKEYPQVYALRGDAEMARGKTMAALRWWEQGWDVSEGEERREAKQHIADALDRMDATSLNRAREVLVAPPLQALVDERLHGTPGASRPPQKPPTGTAALPPPVKPGMPPPSGPPVPEGVSPQAPLPETARIGVLLPLSGEFASYGQRSLNGIKLGVGELASRLDVRDDKGDPAVGRQAFDAFIVDPNVVAVIGPLRSKVAEVVAPRAETAGVPTVLLSQQDSGTGQWVKQPAMTSASQAAELAEYAIAGQGLRRFGILYPNDPYGVSLSSAFRDEVTRRGGTVVGSIVYDPHQREFNVELLSVDKWIKDDGLQAVFIPDFADSAIPLATQLRVAHPTVALFGSNGWNDPGALGPASADLDGAVFVDGFFPSSTRRATQAFVAAYRGAYGGATPEILEAQAYDAGMLVARILQGGARSRLQVAQALQTPRTVEGAAGVIGIGPQGMQRQLFLLKLSNGTISEIPAGRASSPAPAQPAQPASDDDSLAGAAIAP
ncbi:MAG TPA: penicillin-binding protein activator [Candidatus Dormibacteraeota bacterium]|nr:penicillin-binding protein activator [Candidatus Dormibacteraeota bacterium]